MLLRRSIVFFRRLSSQQPNTSTAVSLNNDLKDKKNIKKKEIKAELEKPKWTLFDDRPFTPTNLSFPNEIGERGYDPDMPLKEVLKDSPSYMKQELLKFVNETKNSINIEKIEAIEDTGVLRHGDTKIEYVFKEPSDMKVWKTGCDSDWGKGYSKCSFNLTDNNTAIFSGIINTKVMKDGKVEKAGWASIKTIDKASFHRKKYMTRWWNYSHLLIKCRGDGRSYKIMLHTPGAIDLTWGDSYSYPLHTHGGPYWQIEKIPFSRFFHTVAGRIQDKQYRIHQQLISSISIVLMDRIDGPFNFELDFIAVTNDKSHKEDFAYETYSLPIFYSEGV
uniref:CIA30 domain-containing protein n=1 Tax=Parastrongyloides trichosuri TaxID=131310 RepID=A0A0N4Z8R0_PARTI